MKFNEPLGLPQGTVRALLAVIVVVAAIASIFVSVDPSDKAFIFSMAGVAFGYYFGARQSETAVTGKSEPLDQAPPKNLLTDDNVDTRIVPGNEIDKVEV